MSHKCISSFFVDFQDEHKRMIKSLTHFHPEVNLETIKRREYLSMGLPRLWSYPIIELALFKKYTTVTHLDADIIITDRIDELWDDATDVRAGRNNTNNNRCANHKGVTVHDVPWDKYVNAGIHSISSLKFAEEWLEYTTAHVKNFKYREMDTFNILFHRPRYRSKILDPLGSDVCWGTSLMEGTVTFWDSWKEIVVAGDHLEYKGKRIKLLHMAGGLPKRPPLRSLVTTEVNEFMEEILR